MALAEENAVVTRSQLRDELQGVLQTLQTQMVRPEAVHDLQMEHQAALKRMEAETQASFRHLEDLLQKQSGSGMRFQSPIPHFELQTGFGMGGENFCQGDSSTGDGFLKPKSVCLYFPRFDGEDAETWSCRAEQFFEYYHTPIDHRLSITSFHMDSHALVWFRELRASNPAITWPDFVRSLQIRFGKGSYDDPMETLSKLKQEGPLEEYKTQFDTLALKVQHLPEFHKLSCFLGGLKDEIRLPVRMFHPKTLVDAYSLARMQEEYSLTPRRYPRSIAYSNPSPHPTHGLSVQLPVGFTRDNAFQGHTRNTLQGQTRQIVTTPPGGGLLGKEAPKPSQSVIPVQRITQAQMEERR
jgi:hypothetical protein